MTDAFCTFITHTTKSATRRWCSLGCMNRARSAQHYREIKKTSSRPDNREEERVLCLNRSGGLKQTGARVRRRAPPCSHRVRRLFPSMRAPARPVLDQQPFLLHHSSCCSRMASAVYLKAFVPNITILKIPFIGDTSASRTVRRPTTSSFNRNLWITHRRKRREEIEETLPRRFRRYRPLSSYPAGEPGEASPSPARAAAMPLRGRPARRAAPGSA